MKDPILQSQGPMKALYRPLFLSPCQENVTPALIESTDQYNRDQTSTESKEMGPFCSLNT